MAGILDNLPPGGIFDYIRQADKATEPFTGSLRSVLNPNSPVGGGLLDFLNKGGNLLRNIDQRTSSSSLGGFVEELLRQPQQPPALNVPQSGDLGLMYGQPQAAPQPSPQQPPQQALPPSIASSPMSPQGAEQAFNLPTGSYQFGGQMVPTFGQPQASPEMSAQRRGGAASVQINPQGNPIAPQAVTPGATETGQDKWMEFLDRLSPDYVSRYRQTRQQQKSAQNLATFFQGQGMAPQQAAAMAAVAASNPKIMEEFFKQPSTVEGALARDMAFGTGGGGRGNAQAKALDWMRNKNMAEKAGTIQGESQAQAQIDLPGAVATAKEQLRLLDELANHPGRKQVGWHDFLGKAPLVPSTKGYDAANLLEQVKSGAFMTAFQNLKGGGQITEKEGQAATAAIARMDRATSQAEFDKALEEYKGVIRLGVDRASQKAGQAAPFGFQGNQGWGQLPGGARFKKVSD